MTALRERLLRLPEEDADERTYLREVLSDLRGLLATEYVLAYDLEERGAHHEVGLFESPGLDAERFGRSMNEMLSEEPVRWGLYNPACPEPEQRNRVIAWTAADIDVLVQSGKSAVALRVYPKVGVGARAQTRVLVCDGPSMLAWVGAFQPAPFDERQTSLLAALVPAFRRRLRYQRLLGDGARASLLSAALDAVAGVAIVTTLDGRISYANAAGRRLLDAEGASARSDVARAVTHPNLPSRWSSIALAVRGGPPLHLVVARPGACDAQLSARIARAAAIWELTARQREVLEKLAEGNANRTIGAMLGISARTVEIHVTALLDKAQVENRAELVAKVHSFA